MTPKQQEDGDDKRSRMIWSGSFCDNYSCIHIIMIKEWIRDENYDVNNGDYMFDARDNMIIS